MRSRHRFRSAYNASREVLHVTLPDYDALQKRFGDRFIARRGDNVVASAETYDELLDALERMAVARRGLIIEYVSPSDRVHVA
jgi:hypothetical protein